MTQPTLRTKLTHDPASFEGKSYVPITLAFTVDGTSGSGVKTIFSIPEGAYVKEVFAVVTEAFDGGTALVGVDGNTDEFIASGALTITSKGSAASSEQTTLPAGMFYAAQDNMVVALGGAITEGKLLVLVTLWDTYDIARQGVHLAT